MAEFLFSKRAQIFSFVVHDGLLEGLVVAVGEEDVLPIDLPHGTVHDVTVELCARWRLLRHRMEEAQELVYYG